MPRTFVRDDSLPWVGSVSALRILAGCHQAFQNKYIKKLERDKDWVRPIFFAFGSAAHTLLEQCNHDCLKLTTAQIKTVCDLEGLKWETEGAKLAACLRAYGANATPMRVIAVEHELIGQNWVIYIDAIMTDEKKWYMVDTKFVGSLDKKIEHKLERDNQVWLYMAAHQKVAIQLGIPVELEFGGFLYREVEKPAIKAKKTPETWEEFTERCGTPEYRETLVPFNDATCKIVIRNMMAWLSFARSMKAGDIVCKNYNNCTNNNVVCEFFSHCHGHPFSGELEE